MGQFLTGVVSTSLDELWARFTQSYTGKLILVLDEVDLLSEKDQRRDILYLISRAPQGAMAILLSNHPRFLNTLDESIRSTLQPELFHFRNYDAKQIAEILEDRARAGLHSPPENIPKIAALTTHFGNSDVRVAIKTLYHSALEPEEDIEQVFQRARRDLTADVLANLDERCLLILRAAVETPERFVKQVYSRYRSLSHEHHQDPYSYVYFYTNLSYLQSIGLILLVSTKVGRTYTNQIQPLFDRELLDAVCRVRWR